MLQNLPGEICCALVSRRALVHVGHVGGCVSEPLPPASPVQHVGVGGEIERLPEERPGRIVGRDLDRRPRGPFEPHGGESRHLLPSELAGYVRGEGGR